MRVTLRNSGRGPRGVHDLHRRAQILKPGEEREVDLSENMIKLLRQRDGDLVVLNVSEKAPQPPAPKPAKEIRASKSIVPADWESLPWPRLRSLATKVANGPISTKPEALAAIRAEVEKNGVRSSDG